ncbi:transcriptional co activator crsp77 [Echinococcus multilocularis]|uniref:Transcriptional co activator crsp77 n=1 Tax=Echinococcus multilocularis TaxID=6211 RepID=A0A077R4H6_ECHMU|nr:transcriptional co activator crsp77 [Echinococcus multilocularis]
MQGRGKNYLPIEALCEFKVYEILNDGQEIVERPLTAAENFQRVVNGIDFSDENFGKQGASEAVGKDVSYRIPDKTWMLLRDQIRKAYTEACAFIELMAVLKETKCLSLCQVASGDQDRELDGSGRNVGMHTITCLSGKKMALTAAAGILLKGAERFRSRYFEIAQAEQRFADGQRSISYHEGLMQLRRSWRLKLGQNVILGDASLRCIGSRAKEGGNFEVSESDFPKSDSDGSFDVVKVKFSSTMESMLTNDLCTGRLRVVIRRLNPKHPNDWYQFLKSRVQISAAPRAYSLPKSQSDKLYQAQNLLMCREILSTLSYEASIIGMDETKSDLVAFSSLGKVVAAVFPGVQLSISLERLIDDDCNEEEEEEHPGLSTQLKRIIFLQHIHSWSNIASVPNPPTGPVQVPRRLRAAGATITLRNTGNRNGDGGTPIITACVAGFGGPAASAWMTSQSQAFSSASGPLPGNHHQPFAVPVGQERYTYFNDWGSGYVEQQQQHHQMVPASMDEVTTSGLTLSGLEHALRLNQASSAAIACILGSGDGLLMQIVSLARHRVLRQRVALCLTQFARGGGDKAVTASVGMCVTILWHSIASPLSSGVSVTFNSVGYSSFRTRLTVCVGVDEVSIYGVCGAAQSLTIPATADVQGEILRILKTQELRNQMLTIQGIASKFLGWIQLGCSSIPSVDNPLSALLMASHSGSRIVCIRGDTCYPEGLEFLVAKTTQSNLTNLASDGELLRFALTTSTAGQDGAFDRGQFIFRKVDLARLPGRHVVGKIESLLTCLNCP